MHRILPRIVALSAFALLLVIAGHVQAGDPNRVEGTVAAVGSGHVTIRTRGGTAVQVTVSSSTKIERNGRRVALSAFKVGDRGQARLVAGSQLATKVEAAGP